MRTPDVAMRLVNAYVTGLRQRLPNFVLSYLDKLPCGNAEDIIKLAELYPNVSPELLFLLERFDGTVWQPSRSLEPNAASTLSSSAPDRPAESVSPKATTTAKNLLKSAFICKRGEFIHRKPPPPSARLRHGAGLPVLGSALDACPYVLLPVAQLIRQGREQAQQLPHHTVHTDDACASCMQHISASVSTASLLPYDPHFDTRHNSCGSSSDGTTDSERDDDGTSSYSSPAMQSSPQYTIARAPNDTNHAGSNHTIHDRAHTDVTTRITTADTISSTNNSSINNATHLGSKDAYCDSSKLSALVSPHCKKWTHAESVAALYAADRVSITHQWPPAASQSLSHSDCASHACHETAFKTNANEHPTKDRRVRELQQGQNLQGNDMNVYNHSRVALDNLCDADTAAAAADDTATKADMNRAATSASTCTSQSTGEEASLLGRDHQQQHTDTAPPETDTINTNSSTSHSSADADAQERHPTRTRREHIFSWSRVAAAVASGVIRKSAASRYRNNSSEVSSSQATTPVSPSTNVNTSANQIATVYVDPRIDIHASFRARLVFAESLHFHQRFHSSSSSARVCCHAARDGSSHNDRVGEAACSPPSASSTFPTNRHSLPDRTLKTALSWLFLDFEPDVQAGGKAGQVVQYMHNPDSFIVIADDFGAYVKHIMSNEYRFTEELEESRENDDDGHPDHTNTDETEAHTHSPT